MIGDPARDFRREGPMVRQLAIELETRGDSRTKFRLRIDASLIADDLTAAQAHVLVGEILERITLPKRSEGAPLAMAADPITRAQASSPRPFQGRARLRDFVDALFGRADAAA